MSPLETLIASAVRNWHTDHNIVCQHARAIDYGSLAETLASQVREQIASEIEGRATKLDTTGWHASADELREAARVARGGT
ncbi:hypothetical protein [Actinomadura litoris]|uniref:Uncharacterized protein n=1 Tax=Actinomadura litoris TaxID=2678616 RepID=A0A7K1LAM3_9ACTN|nr:hypothetical protein [Actinomadura litoris]MUN41464.1 hypothetical protein [Actinomadura litoris]